MQKNQLKNTGLILGIETSCDETAAAVYCQNTKRILSSELFSQIPIHQAFGGVLPEAAARSHVQKIDIIVQKALDSASVTIDQIETIAVTRNPGLIGSLLVGICFAKTVAWACNKKLIAADHNHGHILSATIDSSGQLIEDFIYPHICLSLSGGHTTIFLVHSNIKYEVLADTLDDSAGETFDKISKLMGLGYPGGPVIEALAKSVGFVDFFNYVRPMAKDPENFSFSGLKTAVFYHLLKLEACDKDCKPNEQVLTNELKAQVASSLLVAIKDMVLQKLELILKKHGSVKAVSFVGGVACNRFMVEQIKSFCDQRSLVFYSPGRRFCTDNGAMIALVGDAKIKNGCELDTLDFDVFRN